MGYIDVLRQHIGHAPILTAGAILFVFNEHGQVLMQLRNDYKQWGFPGGAMELGENFEQTAKRELEEETNLKADDLELVEILSGKDTYREYPNGDKLYDITAAFVVKEYHGELKPNDESLKMAWFDVDNLPNELAPHTRNYLQKFNDILVRAGESGP